MEEKIIQAIDGTVYRVKEAVEVSAEEVQKLAAEAKSKMTMFQTFLQNKEAKVAGSEDTTTPATETPASPEAPVADTVTPPVEQPQTPAPVENAAPIDQVQTTVDNGVPAAPVDPSQVVAAPVEPAQVQDPNLQIQ